MGRPSKYKEDFNRQAQKLILLGATDKELAEFFQVHLDTIKEWKNAHPEFSAALKTAKEIADNKVEESLFKRATGYSHEAVKIFCDKGEIIEAPYTEHYPPDTTACIFWLKNRRKEQWRDVHRQEHTGPDGGPIVTQAVDAPPQETREQWLERRTKELLEAH